MGPARDWLWGVWQQQQPERLEEQNNLRWQKHKHAQRGARKKKDKNDKNKAVEGRK